MTWSIYIAPDGATAEAGTLHATIEDEVAAEVRDAVLAIIARPVFERRDQAERLLAAATAESYVQPAPAGPQETTPRPRARRAAMRVWDVTQSAVLDTLTRCEERGEGALHVEALVASVNARRRERGEYPVSASTVREACRKLVLEGKARRSDRCPRPGLRRRAYYTLSPCKPTVIVAGEGVRT
jgi:hypothetical protein